MTRFCSKYCLEKRCWSGKNGHIFPMAPKNLSTRSAICFALLSLLQVAAFAELPESPTGNPSAETDAKPETKAEPDPFDFAGGGGRRGEEQYLELDETIKLRIEPLLRSAVVDRVVEGTTIYVKAPGSVRVEVYVEPVDSPYCGKSVGEARLIGQSSDARRNFPVNWGAVENHRYVKIYALAYKRDGVSHGRSRSVDLSMGGSRLQMPRAR